MGSKKRYRPTRIITAEDVMALLPAFIAEEFKATPERHSPMYSVQARWKKWADQQGYQRISNHEFRLALFTAGYKVTQDHKWLLGHSPAWLENTKQD